MRAEETPLHEAKGLDGPGYLRISQIIPAIIPVSKSTWWAGVKSGRFPQPVKLSPGCTAWRKEDIEAWITARNG